MYQRKQLKTLQKRVNEKAKFIQIISGSRQVGKTTLVEQLISEITMPVHYVTADAVPSSNIRWIEIQWETARMKLISNNSSSALLVIDEIQKIDNWSEAIKKQWDRDRMDGLDLRVILLGSSAMLLNKGLSESLTGRFEIITIPHWSFPEMRDAFGFTPEEFAWYGAYPGAAPLINDENRWKEYILYSIIEATISKDILMMTSVQKPALLKNLFELSCIYTGQILSYTKILGELNETSNTTTLAHYQKLLDQIWFSSGIRKFSGSRITSRNSIPKWLVYNNAFVAVYSDHSFKTAKQNTDLWGRIVESSVGSILLNECRVNSSDLTYWRDGNNEVDFIVSRGKKNIAIEVKSGKSGFHKGLEVFSKKYETHRIILISNETIRWKDFLKMELNELLENP